MQTMRLLKYIGGFVAAIGVMLFARDRTPKDRDKDRPSDENSGDNEDSGCGEYEGFTGYGEVPEEAIGWCPDHHVPGDEYDN